MLQRCLTALFVLWTFGAAAVPVLQHWSTASLKPGCCRNEATCPMHRHAPPPNGHALSPCSCGDASTPLLWSAVRGVFRESAALETPRAVASDRTTATSAFESHAAAPPLPPPRIG